MTDKSHVEWQPIEAAPKDGTEVVLWYPRYGVWRCGLWFDHCRFNSGGWQVKTPLEFDGGTAWMDLGHEDQPTHWLKITPPNPPKAKQLSSCPGSSTRPHSTPPSTSCFLWLY